MLPTVSPSDIQTTRAHDEVERHGKLIPCRVKQDAFKEQFETSSFTSSSQLLISRLRMQSSSLSERSVKTLDSCNVLFNSQNASHVRADSSETSFLLCRKQTPQPNLLTEHFWRCQRHFCSNLDCISSLWRH